MKVETFTFNGFQENTSIVYTAEKDAVIIDPGCYDQHEQEALVDFITSHDLTVHAQNGRSPIFMSVVRKTD